MANTRRKAAGPLAPVLAFTLMLNGLPVVVAQAPAPTPPPTGTAPAPASGTATPAAGSVIPAPGSVVVTSGATTGTATVPARTLTLTDIVNLAVNNNSTAVLARQRLQKAQELINQVNAQALPQISASIADTYSSQSSFATQAANVTNPTLPGGGQIPVITDQGGGNTATFIGGGGGGTAPSNGLSGTTTTPATGSGSTTGTGNRGVGTTPGGIGTGSGTTTPGLGGTTGTGTGTGNFGTTGPGTSATPGTGTGTGSSGAANSLDVSLDEVPPIARQYAAVTQTQATPAASAGAAQAKAAPRAGGTTSTTPTATTDFTSLNRNTGSHNNYSGRVSLSQYIDIFGLVPTARDVERITRDFYAIDLNRISNEIALTAKSDYFAVLRDQAQVTVDQQQVAAATENLRITQARFAAGAAPQYDVLTAQVTLSNDQQAVSSAENTLSLALANLDNLLGIDPGTPVNLQEPPLPPLNQTIDLGQSTQIALRQRPELRQADNNITIAEKLIRLAGATLLPTLGLGGSANYAGNVTVGTPHDTYSITAQLNIPLYDGGDTRSRVRSAKVDLQTQQTTRAQLRQNVALEVRQAYLNISDAQTRASSATVGAQQAAEAARIAALRYQNGLGTFLDVINAQAQLAQSQINELNAQYDYQTALAQLVRAVGSR